MVEPASLARRAAGKESEATYVGVESLALQMLVSLPRPPRY